MVSGWERAKARAAARVRFTAANTSKQRRASANAPCTSGRNGGHRLQYFARKSLHGMPNINRGSLYICSRPLYNLYGRPLINYICCILSPHTWDRWSTATASNVPKVLFYSCHSWTRTVRRSAVGTNERQMTRQEEILTVLQ